MAEIALQDSISPRELRLEHGARILRWGAVLNTALSVIVLVLAAVAGMHLIPNLFITLQSVLLARYTGSPDTALALVILITLLNLSALLVLMVGVVARELWSLPALWVLAILNGAALFLLGYTPALLTAGISIWAGVRLGRDVRAFRINPVMLKELRGRMRGIRAFLVLTVYLGLMSGFAMLLYLVYNSLTFTSGSAAAGEVGRVLFIGVVGIELLLIIFIAPAFTAGAITGERERQTYDLLRTTLLASPSFVIGKLESALGYILLLLLAGIPLQSIAFIFGGVSELELILSFVILTVTAIALGTVGIYFSAALPRTLSASVRAYTVIVVAMFIAPVVLSIVLDLITRLLFESGSTINAPLLEAVLRYLSLLVSSVNPITTALTTQSLLIDRQAIGFWMDTLRSDGSTIPMVSPWILYTIIYLVVSALLVVLAIRRTHSTEI
jgi:ABC-2 type transport system permease protein